MKPSSAHDEYRLLLFVAGDEPNSRLARRNLDALCGGEMSGRCHVEIVDVLENHETAAHHQILVTPTLLLTHPQPSVMIIGNLRDHDKVRGALRWGTP